MLSFFCSLNISDSWTFTLQNNAKTALNVAPVLLPSDMVCLFMSYPFITLSAYKLFKDLADLSVSWGNASLMLCCL